MERPAKLRKLNAFRRSLPHCSASALGAILAAIKKDGLPDGPTSRGALREARNLQNKELTPYGPILTAIDLIAKEDDPNPVSISIAHPCAMIIY